MAFFRGEKRRPPSDKIENVLGASARFSGHLQAEGGVRIDGIFEGTIETEGNLIVGKGAQVIADVKAYNITVAGAIEGNVTAAGRLEILSTGRVRGDISTTSLLIEEGGMFHGQSLMEDDTIPRLEPPRTEPRSSQSEDGETEPAPVKRGEIVEDEEAESEN